MGIPIRAGLSLSARRSRVVTVAVVARVLAGCGGGDVTRPDLGPWSDAGVRAPDAEGGDAPAQTAGDDAAAHPEGDDAGARADGGDARVDSGPMSLGPMMEEGVVTLTGGDRSGDSDGPRGFLELNNPVNVLAGAGVVYVADFYNGRVVEVGPDGSGRTLIRRDDFERPFGLAMTSPTTLWIQTDRSSANTPAGALWRLDLTGAQMTVVFEEVGRKRGLTPLPDGRLAMADYEQGTVEIFDPATGQRSILAGASGLLGYTDAIGGDARFKEPRDLVLSREGTLLVVDSTNHCIREVTLAGAVTTYAGADTPGSVDGPRASARFNRPLSLARDPDGNLYVADGDNFVIRRIDLAGTVTTLAGTGEVGFADAEDPLQARFRGLEGLDVTPDGRYLLVADGARGLDEPFNRVRRVSLR